MESLFKTPQSFIWGFLILGILIIFFFLYIKCSVGHFIYDMDFLGVLGFCVLVFVLGILRMQISEFNIKNDELSKLNGGPENIILTGVILGEPDVRDTSQKLKVDINGSAVLVTTSRYPEYQYLDKIKITGKLKTPSETEDFSYKNYLMKDGVYSVMDFPKISVLGKESPNFFQKIYSGILRAKQKIRESIKNNYLPPQSLILEGTILGSNGVLTKDLKDKLNATGLRHIIAVSGTHIVILSAILMSLLLALGFWRGQAFYFSVFLIWLYIILIGMPPSGVRAGIMGCAFLLAQKLGRQNSSSKIVVIAAVLMLVFNPLLLFYDVGFQLSFLASMGIIYIEPFFRNLMKISIVSTTFAAQIFTLPIMVFNFGNISLVSPITNLLILPIVELLMIFGFLSALVGMVSSALGWIFSIPCWILLSYFVKIIEIFSQPWAIKSFQNVHWAWLLISYLLIGILARYAKKLQKPDFL